MKTHAEVKKRLLADPQLRAAYDALEPEFELCSQMISMRQQSTLSQAEIAQRMNTAKSNISRLERSRNPGWQTLNAYAAACGFRLRLVAEKL